LRFSIAALFAGWIAVFLAYHGFGWDVSVWLAAFPGCPIRAATGVLCPGCGMTRAFFLLAQLRVPEALAANPVSPLLAAGLGSWAVHPLGGSPRARDAACWVALAALLAIWAARWLPLVPRLPL
jgi:hypothetical protein